MTNQNTNMSPVEGVWMPTKSYNQILDAVQNLSSVVSTNRACELARAVSAANHEVIDLEHYIEFGTFNDAEAVSIFRKLQTILTNRRNIKQELELINKLLDSGTRELTNRNAFPEPNTPIKKVYTPRSSVTVD